MDALRPPTITHSHSSLSAFPPAYIRKVVAHTISEAQSGRTPNPDVLCNSLVKFGVFYNVMGKHFDRVATGHYARAVREGTCRASSDCLCVISA